jgi:outer membrane receptor protein involved in Fe transport
VRAAAPALELCTRVAIVLVALAVLPCVALSQTAATTFSIPAQPIESALRAYAEQSGDQVVFYSEVAHGKSTQKVEGLLTRGQALDRLLKNTGLSFRRLNASTIAILDSDADSPADSRKPAEGSFDAADADGRPDDAARGAASDAPLLMDSIIVTGTAAPRRSALRSSSAVSVFSSSDIAAQSPTSTAEMLSAVPGFWIEDTAGDTQNNVFARGIVQDGGYRYVALMEDGIPLFPVSELSFYNPDQLVRIDSSVERVEVLRGGTAPVFTPGALGGSVNLITRRPALQPAANLEFTTSSYGTRRVDAWGQIPLSKSWSGGIGGFYRGSDGIRDPGFTSDRGGQIRLGVAGARGPVQLDFFAKYMDDHSLFAVPIPLQGDPRSPRTPDGSNPGTYSLLSRDIARARLPISARQVGLESADLADGIHPRMVTVGNETTWKVGEGVELKSLSRLTSGDIHFDALFPGRAPVTGLEFATEAGVAPDFSYATSGAPFNADDPVQNHGHWAVHKSLWSLQNDTRLNLELATHSLALGVYLANYRAADQWSLGNLLLMDVRSRPRRLRLAQVTDASGYTRYASFTNDAAYRAHTYSVYLSDEWSATRALRFDTGIRFDSEDVRSRIGESDLVDLDGDPQTLYDNATSVLTGADRRIRSRFEHVSVSLGFNYELDEAQALFGHYTSAAKLPHFDDIRNGVLIEDEVTGYELGYKLLTPKIALSAALFQTDFNNVPFTDILSDGTTVVRRAGTRTRGIEIESEFIPLDWLRIRWNGTLQRPEYVNFTGSALDNSGNVIRRIPRQIVKVTPTASFLSDRVRVSVSFAHVGRRFANDANTIELPAFDKLDASVQLDLKHQWQLVLSGDNLTDSAGLTEGNPRTDLSDPAANDYYMARPLFGRSFHAALSKSF